MASTLIGFWIRAVRWGSLIHEPRPIRRASLFGATMIGFMANNVLPLRLGEFIRPWALARREKLSRSTLFATVVVERAIDMVTLLVIFGISLLVHPISSETEAGRMTQAGASVLVTACAVLTVFVIALERSEKLARAVIDRSTVHVDDLVAEPDEEFRAGRELARRFGHRTMLAVPLIREGVAIGVICAFRFEVRPGIGHFVTGTETLYSLLTTPYRP